MSFLTWIVLGLLAGFIASKVVNKQGQGAFLEILLGITGAVLGYLLMHAFGVRGVNLQSLIVAVGGAILVLILYHSLRRTA